MNRYTTKHFWRMKESEQGEWVRHDEHQKLIEDHKAQEQFTWDLMREEQVRKWEAMGLAEHLRDRIYVLSAVFVVTYVVIVAKLIVWSLGIL